MIKYIKSQMKNIPMMIIMVVLFYGITTFATNYLFESKAVKYNNSTSGVRQDNVQGAIDELYACASDYATYRTRLTNAENTIGTGSLTTTSQTLIGGINELNGKLATKGLVTRLTKEYDNVSVTTSGKNGYYHYGEKITVPSGYTPVSALWYGDFNTGVYPVLYQKTNSEWYVALNVSESVTGITGTVKIMCVRTEFAF